MQGQISFNADGILETVEQPAADAPEIIQNAWKKAKQDKVKEFREKQELSYEDKIARQSLIAKEFYDEMQKRGCGAQGHFAKNSRMKLPNKWLQLFGGPENKNESVNYNTAPFKVSNKCCYWLKEKPCDDWAKEHNSFPYLGIMASEGGQREEALIEHGCIKTQRATACHGEHERWRREHGTEKDNDGNRHRKGRARVG